MGIEEDKCDICGAQLDLENYYYLYLGRLQQGVMSNSKAMNEYKLCTSCFNTIKGNILVMQQRNKKGT
ncbi:MAG: hypothetical protein QXL16_01460 [Candidatus Micrarchaeaceae archaeon]